MLLIFSGLSRGGEADAPFITTLRRPGQKQRKSLDFYGVCDNARALSERQVSEQL